jgi:hypothetical protein
MLPGDGADVFEVEVRNADGGNWISVDALETGPFEIDSMGGWYEKYFRVRDAFYQPWPDRIQVRFKACGFSSMGAVEAGIDAFEVAILDS